MSKVFVVDAKRHPLDPVRPGRARLLLNQGMRRFPFTIVLKVVVEQSEVHPLRVKIDLGRKTTGIAIANDTTSSGLCGRLTHRGQAIKDVLDTRRSVRRGRRQRKTRYRKARFANRTRPKGWLPPSLESRMSNVLTWVQRLIRVCPLAALSQEVVRFDMQHMEQPEITGRAYQQGTLAGYETREYLLEKWKRACAYCGKKEKRVLRHMAIPPRSKDTGFPCHITMITV